jgi:hypothetical protein
MKTSIFFVGYLFVGPLDAAGSHVGVD